MDTEYDNSRVERLKRGLYKPEEKHATESRRPILSPSQVDVENDWGDTDIVTDRKVRPPKPWSVGLLKSLVVFAVLTAFGSGGYLLYQYYDPLGKPSDKNIIITFEVPVGVNPGVPADVIVHVANQNRVALEYANLSILYPSGTRAGDNSDKDLNTQKQSLGVIGAGETKEYRTQAIFLGEESEEKEIRAVLEYRFQGINAVFPKEYKQTVRMLTAPVNLTVNTLKEINSGQQLELVVNASSNTVIPLRDVLLKIEYPQGFTFASADPKPTFGNNVWRVGRLDPAGKFSVAIRGVLQGSNTQQGVFHTTLGIGSDKTERNIGTVYNKVLSEVTLRLPFIGVNLLINNMSAGKAVVAYGQKIGGTVEWKNNLSTRITDAEIEVKLRGVALDRTSVEAGFGGFYRSLEDTIFWDKRGNPSLALLESGANGKVTFSFNPLPLVSGNQLITNPNITAEVTVRGRRMSDLNVPEELKTVMVENVRISSEAQMIARSVYFVGPFVNSGPFPPRVEQETTYTVIWSITNTSNAISNARVRGVIPAYVNWYGSVSPSGENIVYNKVNNEIVWSPGDIPAGTGVSRPPREVAFQLVVQPSLTQLNEVLTLMNDTVFTATDSFTNAEISRNVRTVTTDILTDPKAAAFSGAVVE